MSISLAFTRDDTAWCKGVAILAMLLHHAVPNHCGLPLWANANASPLALLASACKVCVALLTVLSGFGLSESYSRKTHSGLWANVRFVASHLFQLMANYWPVLLWAWVMYWLRGIGPRALYGGGFAGLPGSLWDALGISGFVGTHVLVGTWYLSAIVSFYVLFPLAHWLVKRLGVLVPIALYLPWLWYFLQFDYDMQTDRASFYLYAFALGIWLSQRGVLRSWKEGDASVAASLALLAASLAMRALVALPADVWVALAVLRLCASTSQRMPFLGAVLKEFGRRSADLWLMHGTILAALVQLPSRGPLSVFALLAFWGMCLSYGLGAIRRLVGYDRAIAMARGWIA